MADASPISPTKCRAARRRWHFGEPDESILLTAVDIVQAKRGDYDIHVYDGAAHGFHCDERGSFHADAANTA